MTTKKGLQTASVQAASLNISQSRRRKSLEDIMNTNLNDLVSKGIIKCVKAGGRKFHRPTLDSILLKRMEGAA
jgi:predicted transcriptional regulator